MRSTSRRGLGFLLSAALAVGLVPFLALADTPDAAGPTDEVAAEEAAAPEEASTGEQPAPEEDPVLAAAADEIHTMTLNEEQRVSLAEEEQWVGVFTAPEDGSYAFISFDNDEDTYGKLYSDADLTDFLDEDDDSGGDGNFMVVREMTEGETVYLRAFGYGDRAATFSVTVEQVDPYDFSRFIFSIDESEFDLDVGDYAIDATLRDLDGNDLDLGTDYELAYFDRNEDELDAKPSTPGIYYVAAVPAVGSPYTGMSRKVEFTLTGTPEPQVMELNATYDAFAPSGGWWIGIFTAPQDGEYLFESTGNHDTYARLYSDEELTDELTDDDDSGEGANFRLPYTLTAGQTVYLKAYEYDYDQASFSVSVTLFDPHDLSCGHIGLYQHSFAETGSAIVPDVWVEDYQDISLSASDYDLAYYDYDARKELASAPATPGTYGVKAVGKGAYHGETSYVEYRIVPANDLAAADFEFYGDDFAYTGSPIDVSPYISIFAPNGTKLVEGTDYELVYFDRNEDDTVVESPVEIGRYLVCAVACSGSNYTGSTDRYDFTIYDAADIGDGRWSLRFWPSSTVAMTKSGVSLPTAVLYVGDDDEDYATVSTQLVEGTDFELDHVENSDGESFATLPAVAGRYDVYYRGKGNYHGVRSGSIRVYDATLLSGSTVTFKHRSLTYTGSPVEPEVRITDRSGNLLVEGTDYQLKGYVNSEDESLAGAPVEPGTYDVTYEGLGDYSGEVTSYFYVTDGLDLAKGWVDLRKYWFNATGEAVDLQATVHTDTGKTLTEGIDYELVYVSMGTDGSTQLSGAPSEAGDYRVFARAKDGSAYRGETAWESFVIEAQVQHASVDLSLGVPASTNIDRYDYWLGRFVAPDDGLYAFTSSNASGDPYGQLYSDEERTKLLDSDDDSAGDRDFLIVRTLKKGEVVYVEVRGYENNELRCNVTVTKADEHDLKYATLRLRTYSYPATGSPITPDVTVIDAMGKTLVRGVDYELTYEMEYPGGMYKPVTDTSAVGHYYVAAVAKGSTYTGKTYKESFRVRDDTDLDNGTIRVEDRDLAYTGNSIEPAVTIKDGSGKTLVKGTDYELAYVRSQFDLYVGINSAPKDPGTYAVYAKGKGRYSGQTGMQSFIIYDPYDLEEWGEVTLQGKAYYDDDDEDLPAYGLSGSRVEPPVTVSHELESTSLVAGTDYTVTYANNTGETTYSQPASVTITGKGRYHGSITSYFAITSALDIEQWLKANGASVTQDRFYDYVQDDEFGDITYLYTGAAMRPTVTFAAGAADVAAPVAGTDFVVSYANTKGQEVTPTEIGSYDIVLTAQGSSFVGTAKIPFRIVGKMDLSNSHVSRVTTYDGKTITDSGTGKSHFLTGTTEVLGNLVWSLFDGARQLVEGVDYTLEVLRDDMVGVINYLFTGKGNYTGTVGSSVYVTEPLQVSLVYAKVTVPNVTYNGRAQTPTVGVAVYGSALKLGTDYTVAYANNVNAGTATVTVTGKGNYKDSVKATFRIAKADNTLTAKAGKPSVKASKVKKKAQKLAAGKVVKVSGAYGAVTYKKASGNKKITIAKNGKVTIKKGLKKGTYKVVINVTAAGNANYNAATKKVTVKIKVK